MKMLVRPRSERDWLKKPWGAVLIALMTLAVGGCGDLSATVTGSIQLDGKPLEIGARQRGMVVFRPVAGGATCTGLVGKGGVYEIATGSSAGLVPGDYLVSVRVIELNEPTIKGGTPTGRPITPAVYADPLTSGLSTLVGRGANRYDIKLDSAAGPAQTVSVTPAEPDAPAEPAGPAEQGLNAEQNGSAVDGDADEPALSADQEEATSQGGDDDLGK